MPIEDRYEQYELLRREDGSFWELGRGAMGITFKAYDTNLRFPVALKVINSAYLESDTARQRFLREARAAAALRHPNVASVFNLGTTQESYFYVMEFIDGETLEARVAREGPLKPPEALNIALQVTRALAVAARQQLVHRDLKPTNLMLVDQEGELIVKVIDFGLAKITKDTGEDSAALTLGGFVGTPHFASPEQVEEGEVDIRSDIYSLGATLYFVLTGQSPFTGSVGQIMSQHLYKPLPLEPLKGLPHCVASLVQRMMEKDRNARPQTPQELQKEILKCLDEIRGLSTEGVHRSTEPVSPSETADLTVASSSQPLAPGVTVAQVYYLLEQIGESPCGRKFWANDLLHNRRVSLLVLSPDLFAETASLTSLRETVNLVRKAPHPMLREIYSLETFPDFSLLAEEYVIGTSLLDVLRVRGALTAPEIIRLLSVLAPLADHASSHGLRHIDFTLSGIYLINREPSKEGFESNVLRRHLTDWDSLHAKVNAIDFSFLPALQRTWSGMATQMQAAGPGGSTGSCVRSLCLVAYELLGGPRARLDATGRYTPIALLTQEGNAVLRRGLVDEYKSVAELVRHLAATVRVSQSTSQSSGSGARSPSDLLRPPTSPGIPSEPLHRPMLPEISAEPPVKRGPKVPAWLLVLASCLILLVVAGIYLLRPPLQIEGLAALTIQTSPSGASILLDNKPPQVPPNTFTHVPFGSHRLAVALDGYEPVKQELDVRRGMAPEVRLQLKPIREIPFLSIQTEPAGASVLLDNKTPQMPPNTFIQVPFGSHQLSVTLDGYEPIKEDLDVRKGMAPELRVQLKPIREIPTLSIQTEPAGASILLDDKAPQVPPNTFTHVPFGSHRLSVTLDGYEPVTQDLDVRKGMVAELRIQLKPIREIPALSIQTEPTGASIVLDDRAPQISPNTFTRVPFGSHQLSVTLDGYEPIKQELEVRRGMAPEIRVELKPIREIPALAIQTEPAGASILLDDKAPQISPNTFTHVPFGSHRLSVALDGYEPVTQDLDVRKGMVAELRIQLKPIREIPTLSIQTEPAGASIVLDDRAPQISPNTFTRVPFGAHRLSVTLDGYEPIKQELEVRRGMAPEIRVQLKPIREIPALAIQTEPAGASIVLDDKAPQMSPNTFTHVPFGSHQLSITLDGYEPVKQDLDVRRGMAPEIRVELKPIREIPALSIQTEPAGASILLDDKAPQVSPNTFTHVPFGSHQLSVTLDGFEPVKQELEVRRGMPPEVRLQLKPILEIPALSIETEPAGASILLDDKPPQVSPNIFTHVPFGPHQLSVTLDGYEPVKENLAIAEGMNPEIQLPLKPIQRPETVESFLRDAQLGDSYAMMRLGRLYLKKGTPEDDAEGFKWLNRAYNAPNRNLEAGAYIGDCYLSGRGTKEDPAKAEEIIMPLANQNVVPAMTLAGRILQYKAEIERTEAARNSDSQTRKRLEAKANEMDRLARLWWERAEKDDWNASAHLGKCYEEGWGGLVKSQEQAEIRYKAGVSHGNALSMLFYGLMIEKKAGRSGEAETLISKAATAGLPSAIKWCNDNHVDFGQKTSDDDHQ